MANWADIRNAIKKFEGNITINTTAPLSGGGTGSSYTLTTDMSTDRLIGRTTAGSGVMEEISVTSPLSLSGGALSITIESLEAQLLDPYIGIGT